MKKKLYECNEERIAKAHISYIRTLRRALILKISVGITAARKGNIYLLT